MKEKDLIQVRIEYSPQPSKLLHNFQLKNKEALKYFKELSEDGGEGGFLYKPSVPLSLMRIYRMSLISAGSISLGSTIPLTKRNIYYVFFV
jgi:hypothetical protein